MKSRTLSGIPASSGRFSGRAFVAERIGTIVGVSTDVLVIKAASMEWLEAFINAKAVVTEVGGRTSHAATICRELGKPCVTAVNGATSLIRSGMILLVDGGAGTVTIIDDGHQ